MYHIFFASHKSRFVELIIPPQFGMVNYVTLKRMKEVLPYEVPPSQHLFYIFTGYGIGVCGDLLRRAAGDYPAALRAAAGSHVDDVVGV